MEKLIYAFCKSDVGAATTTLVGELGPRLKQLPAVYGVQVNVCDERFHGGVLAPIARTQPAIAGTIAVWLDSGFYRRAVEDLIRPYVDSMHGYSVVESQPVVNTTVAVTPGARLEALSHVVFLEKPAAMEHAHWLAVWLDSHTQIAIDTQSTFQYVQNIVLRPLTDNAPVVHGIIEECFPEAACRNQAVFYDAVGNEARLKEHQQRMMESCQRFIDFGRLDLLLTSQYVI